MCSKVKRAFESLRMDRYSAGREHIVMDAWKLLAGRDTKANSEMEPRTDHQYAGVQYVIGVAYMGRLTHKNEEFYTSNTMPFSWSCILRHVEEWYFLISQNRSSYP